MGPGFFLFVVSGTSVFNSLSLRYAVPIYHSKRATFNDREGKREVDRSMKSRHRDR